MSKQSKTSFLEALAEVQKVQHRMNEQKAMRAASMSQIDEVINQSDKAVKTVKTGGGDYNVYKKDSDTAADFRKTYADAKKGGSGSFEWNGKKYSTGQKGGHYTPGSQTSAGNATDASQRAAPVVPDPKDPAQVKKADDMMAQTRETERIAKKGTSDQLSGAPKTDDNATPAQRGVKLTPQTASNIAAAGTAGQADKDQVAKNNAETGRTDGVHKSVVGGAFDPANIAKEREANIAARAAAPAPAAGGGVLDKVKSFFSPKPAAAPAASTTPPAAAAPTPPPRPASASPAPAAAPTPAPAPSRPSIRSTVQNIQGTPSEVEDKESGPTKKDKKLKESMVDAFLKFQENNNGGNIFEAAKKAKKDYDGDGKVESGKEEYLGSKIAAAKKAGRMEEELKGEQYKIDANKNGKIDSDDFKKLKSGKKSEKMKAYRADRDKHGEMEESLFSEAELAYMESVFARSEDEGKGDRTLTDETESAVKRGRGRPAGSKSGSKHGEEGAAETMRVAAQVRTARPYFSAGKEVHDLKHPTTGKTHQVGTKAVNDFNKSYAAAERPHEKDAVESNFVKKHMGG